MAKKAEKKEEKKPAAKAAAKAENPAKAAAPAKPVNKDGEALREPAEIYNEIVPLCNELISEGHKLVSKNNSSAGRRARKITLALGVLFKEFRASSSAYSKKNLD